MSNHIEVDGNKDYVEDYDFIGDGHVHDEYDTDNDGHDVNYMVAEQLLWPRGHWPRLSSNAIVDSRLHCALCFVHCAQHIALHCIAHCAQYNAII